MTFEVLGDQRALLGESPFISADLEHVWWVDTLGQQLFLTHAFTGRTRQWQLPEQVGFVAEVKRVVVVGMQSGLYIFQPTNGSLSVIPKTFPGHGMRYNDACVDAYGQLWAGTMDMDGEAETGRLYRFGDAFEMIEVASPFRRVNGLAHDLRAGRLLVSDSHPDVRSIWSFELTGPALVGERSLVHKMTQEQGRPDGGGIDEDGRYWVANLEGGGLFSPPVRERPEELLKLPIALPTKVAWSADGRSYFTSKSNSTDPLGGCLLVGKSREEVAPFV